jgi:diguanylate cyclase (GGDEF)-like protein/PAS domain S-box-containing protein/putative nucleotidyltransferase with HDIG domain
MLTMLKRSLEATDTIELSPAAFLGVPNENPSEMTDPLLSPFESLHPAHSFEGLHQAQLQQTLDVAQVGVWEYDFSTERLVWSAACERLFGFQPGEFDGTLESYYARLHPDDVAAASAAERAEFVLGEFHYKLRSLWPDGSIHWIKVDGRSLRDETGQPVRATGTAIEITEIQRVAEALERSQERYRAISELTSDYASAYFLDEAGKLQLDWISDAFTWVTGYSVEELTTVGWRTLIHPDDLEESARVLKETLAGRESTCENRIITKSGETRIVRNYSRPMRGPDGKIRGVYGAARDITDQKRLEAEREMLLKEALQRADRDPLTGLLNHRAFHRALEEETRRVQRQRGSLAVVLLDMDNFKFFNDAYGHLVGDEVLCQVATALRACSRSYDVLSRYGGDEFALVMSGIGQEEVDPLAARLGRQLGSLGYRPPGYDTPIPFSLSVGIALFPGDGRTALDVLHIADERMRHNKTGGEKNGADPIRRSLLRSVEGFAMLDALVTSVDTKDRYTRRHSEEVLLYSQRISRVLGLDEATQQIVQIGALLHDIGKIGVPDGILRKPGRLTREEVEAIKLHATMGAAIVGAVPGFDAVLDGIRHHHEHWDGTGYPGGLCGEAIPLTARLIAVADAYSAMTTDRPYRKAMTPEQAIDALNAGAGRHWDPLCVQAFLRT